MHKCIRNVLQCKINQMRQESARHKKLSLEHSWHTGEIQGTKWTCWQMHLVYNCTDPTGAAFQGGRKSPCLCAGDRKLSKKKLTFILGPDLQETPSQVLLSTTGGMDRLMNNKQNPPLYSRLLWYWVPRDGPHLLDHAQANRGGSVDETLRHTRFVGCSNQHYNWIPPPPALA